jgi:poly-gamma-glutamate synthesis protein (capsule biosynthesis protein)
MLKAIPFQVACLANNHILDFGKEGLARTIDVLQRAGMKTVGAGITDELAAEPLLVDVKGVPLAIINCAEGEQCRSSNGGPGANGFELHRISEQIRALKASGAVVIVVYHGGREYIPVPPVYVVRQLRELANQGADAVIAHHPHVPQGMELYRGVPIVYSQGNFLFWMRSPLFYRRAGYLVHLDFCGSTLVGLEITPYYQEETGIRLMGPRMRHQFAADMDAVSDLLTTPGAIELAWDAIADAEADHFPKVLEQAAEGIRKNKRAMTARTGNMFATPAWRELWIHLSQRLITDQVGTSPEWARQWLQLWSSYTAAEAEALDNCSSKERGD